MLCNRIHDTLPPAGCQGDSSGPQNFFLAFSGHMCYPIEAILCRCDGMVDVVDSKSTAGDSVPVRVRSPAPIKKHPLVGCFFIGTNTGLEPIQMRESGGLPPNAGWTAFAPSRTRVRSPAPKNTPYGVFFIGINTGPEPTQMRKSAKQHDLSSLASMGDGFGSFFCLGGFFFFPKCGNLK